MAVSFSELKSRVGVDDIAFSLGYCLDKKAGVGKYIELVLGDPANPTDKIIVRNTTDKSRQIYFRRDGSKGDVVTFVKENLNAFMAEGKNDWAKVQNVLLKAANLPMVNLEDRDFVKSVSNSPKHFDPTRYKTLPVKVDKMPYLLKMRGFSEECVKGMGNAIVLIQDTFNRNYDGYNIGFPYVKPNTLELAGYEIRGNKGFKSKATGTDSSHSAWIAEFPQNARHSVRNVYFFESSFDAMAFYQINRVRLINTPFALVSVGGAFNQELTADIMKRFPVAKAWDCFDNDMAGQIYSANLVNAVDKLNLEISNSDDIVTLKHGDKKFQYPKEEFSFRQAMRDLGISYSCGHWKSPGNYKDWNDCLLGKEIEPKLITSKYQRDENLAQQRKSSIKL